VPVLRMMGQSAATLRARAERLAGLLGGMAELAATTGFAGGGTLPGVAIASVGVCLVQVSPERLAARLRQHRPAIIGRIAEGRFLLDMLTVADAELPVLAQALREAVAE